jgi:hypothetical protein
MFTVFWPLRMIEMYCILKKRYLFINEHRCSHNYITYLIELLIIRYTEMQSLR